MKHINAASSVTNDSFAIAGDAAAKGSGSVSRLESKASKVGEPMSPGRRMGLGSNSVTPWELFYRIFEDPFFFSDHNPDGLHSTLFRFLSLTTTQTINLLIVVATGALCMESMPEYNPKRPGKGQWKEVWDALEVFCVIMFSLDFFARLLGSAMCGRVRDFAGDVLNYIDLFAILPFYVEIFVGDMVDLRFVRVIRLVRILRTLRNPRFGNMGAVISHIVTESAGALLVPLYFMMLSLVLFSSMIFSMESKAQCEPANPLDNSTCPTFVHIPEAMYWCATTLTTVNYPAQFLWLAVIRFCLARFINNHVRGSR